MLSKSLDLMFANGEQVSISRCHCGECENTFFVPFVAENEPRYCPYCGIKFLRGLTAEGERTEFQGQE